MRPSLTQSHDRLKPYKYGNLCFYWYLYLFKLHHYMKSCPSISAHYIWQRLSCWMSAQLHHWHTKAPQCSSCTAVFNTRSISHVTQSGIVTVLSMSFHAQLKDFSIKCILNHAVLFPHCIFCNSGRVSLPTCMHRSKNSWKIIWFNKFLPKSGVLISLYYEYLHPLLSFPECLSSMVQMGMYM